MAGVETIDQISLNLNNFYFSGRSELTPCCDLEEIIGPVEIFETDGMCMGYGLRTTSAVKRGGLLMLSKAIASCVREYEIQLRRSDATSWTQKSFAQALAVDSDSNSDWDSSACTSPGTSTEDDSISGSFDEDLYQANVSRVPAEVSEVLVRGIEEGLTDSARRLQIHALQNNMFQRDGTYSKANLDAEFYRSIAMAEPADNRNRSSTNNLKALAALQALKGYLPGLVARNASHDDVRWREEVASTSASDPAGFHVKDAEFWGLWLLPSFINHSCTPNCRRQRVGEYLDIRAAVDIELGEVLTLPYFNIFKPISVRDESSKQWGFRCCCSRCILERGSSNPRLLETQRDLMQMYQLLESLLRSPNQHMYSEVYGQTLLAMGVLTAAIDEELEKFGSKEVAEIPELPAEHQHQHSQSTGGEGRKSGAEGGAEPSQSAGKIAEGGAGKPVGKLSSENAEGRFEESSHEVAARVAEGGAESFNSENAEHGAQQSTSKILKGIDKEKPDMSASEHPHHESRNVEDSKKTNKAAKKKKRKEEKKEMKKISQQKDMDQASESVRAIWEKRAFIKDDAARKQLAVAEEYIREVYVAAAQGASEGGSAAVKHWGYTDSNPFDKIWQRLDLKFLKQNLQRNPLYYYVKASSIDAYLATFALETVRAAEAARNADAIVSYVAAIGILIDMLTVIVMTSGSTGLATELMLQLTLNFQSLYKKLPARASAVELRIVEECLAFQDSFVK